MGCWSKYARNSYGRGLKKKLSGNQHTSFSLTPAFPVHSVFSDELLATKAKLIDAEIIKEGTEENRKLSLYY